MSIYFLFACPFHRKHLRERKMGHACKKTKHVEIFQGKMVEETGSIVGVVGNEN